MLRVVRRSVSRIVLVYMSLLRAARNVRNGLGLRVGHTATMAAHKDGAEGGSAQEASEQLLVKKLQATWSV